MASAEQENESQHQPEGKPEQESIPYYKAARFKGEESAVQAYFQTQEAIFKVPECDVSAYRFHINRIWHVAVLGETPREDLDQKLHEILSTGEPVSLPPYLLKFLTKRRNQAIKKGPWVERHYRLGQDL